MHLRPGALRAHAATAAGLVDELSALRVPDGPGELAAALVRARRELGAVRDALLVAASAAEEADATAAAALRSAAAGPGPVRPAGEADPSWVAELGGRS